MSILVFGGGGALGAAVVKHFKSIGYKTFAVDFGDTAADHTIKIAGASLEQDTKSIHAQLSQQGVSGNSLDVVVGAAGGWSGGSIASDEVSCRQYITNIF